MKVAIVHEWMVTIGGSEKVFKEITDLYPDADIFTLVSLEKTVKQLGLENRKITTSFIQKLPFGVKKYRAYLAFFPLAIEQFDLSSYDVIISSSHAVAKGVLTNGNQIHVCYCHSPIRYAWDLYHQYLKEAGLHKGVKGWIAKIILHKIRIWDYISAARVDYFIANSDYIGKRIKKVYGRDSVTIYPNVSVSEFYSDNKKEDFYFTCSRLVPYKKIDIIVQAFAEMPDKRLVVIGDGPDYKKIKRMATKNVEMIGYQSFEVLKSHMSKAKAFVFAAEEDFGIIPVEAQAAGTPVIAYGRGGSTETVIEGKTGLFFYQQTPEAIIKAVREFEQTGNEFDTEIIRENSRRFSADCFRQQFKQYMERITESVK